jgi:hypothetical protein
MASKVHLTGAANLIAYEQDQRKKGNPLIRKSTGKTDRKNRCDKGKFARIKIVVIRILTPKHQYPDGKK